MVNEFYIMIEHEIKSRAFVTIPIYTIHRRHKLLPHLMPLCLMMNRLSLDDNNDYDAILHNIYSHFTLHLFQYKN